MHVCVKSRKPKHISNAERCRNYRNGLKAALIKYLGGKCEECGTRENLEFDHPFGREWVAREVWASTRLKIYAAEAEMGLIRLLCRHCNAVAGCPVDTETF